MIAVDTSSWIAFFSDAEPAADDTTLVELALADRQACLPPIVVTELFSSRKLPPAVAVLLSQLPVLHPEPGFGERAGRLRAKLLARRVRAPLADTLIAQSCLDHGVRLVTRDDDFRHFARVAGLRLAL